MGNNEGTGHWEDQEWEREEISKTGVVARVGFEPTTNGL